MKPLMTFVVSLLCSLSAQSQFEYNFVQCNFEKLDGVWTYIFSSSYSAAFSIPVDEQYPLGYLWWKNPAGSAFEETALCTHVDQANADGTLTIRSLIHNADFFNGISDSYNCTWDADNIVEQISETATLAYGESFTYTFEREIPSKNESMIVNYLPTPNETSQMDPFLAEEICFRFEPK